VDLLNRETAAFLDLVTDRGKKLDYARPAFCRAAALIDQIGPVGEQAAPSLH
jgi:hypothetical protein